MFDNLLVFVVNGLIIYLFVMQCCVLLVTNDSTPELYVDTTWRQCSLRDIDEQTAKWSRISLVMTLRLQRTLNY